MRRSDLKKMGYMNRNKNRNKNRNNKVRPKGYPQELITLKDGSVVGGYGVRTQGKNTWEYLVDDGWLKSMRTKDKNLTWVTAKQIRKIEAWTPKRQEILEQSEPYEKRAINQQQQQQQQCLAFATTKMLFKVIANGEEKTLISDFKGNILDPENDHKTVTDYLAALTNQYGNDKVSFHYQYQ